METRALPVLAALGLVAIVLLPGCGSPGGPLVTIALSPTECVGGSPAPAAPAEPPSPPEEAEAPGGDLDLERVRRMLDAPPSETIEGPLAGWPHPPRFVRKMVLRFSDGTEKSAEYRGRSWPVFGKYLVTAMDEGGVLRSVTVHDDRRSLLRRWSVLPDGSLQESAGVFDPERRQIAWTGEFGGGRYRFVSIETAAEGGVRWTTRTFRDGRFLFSEEGASAPGE